MTNVTPKFDNIKFKDWMAPKCSDSLGHFFDTLSDGGIDIAITAERFLEDEHEAFFNLEQLGDDLVFYGKWLIAKVAAFKRLKEIGFERVKSAADYQETMKVEMKIGFEPFEGEWCQNNGVIYATYGGAIEVASASEAKTERARESENRKTAKFLLLGLCLPYADDAKAA